MAKLKDINLDTLRLKPRNRVALIGVELEGGWTTIPKDLRREDFIRDGSLDPLQRLHPEALVMELPSPPLELAAMETWMRDHWPQLVDVHCGMHVHLSFRTSLAYSKVCREEYPGTIATYIRKWAEKERLPKSNPIWDRLDDKSPYCQHKFFGEAQLRNNRKDHDRTRNGHRYTLVNFCWGRQPTAECRLLPMFADVEQGVRAMKEIVDITNRFLAATAKAERKRSVGWTLSDPERVERHTLRV